MGCFVPLSDFHLISSDFHKLTIFGFTWDIVLQKFSNKCNVYKP